MTINIFTDKETVTRVLVTPAMAGYYLTFNTHNRNERERTTLDFSRHLTNGTFDQYCPHGIVFSAPSRVTGNPVLMDGQHRLYAIQKTGIAAYILVQTGAPMSSQTSIDTSMRNGREVLSLALDRPITARHKALAAAMATGNSGRRVLEGSGNNNLLLVTFYKEHIDVIDKTMALLPKSLIATKLLPSPVIGVFGRALYHVSEAKVSDFVQQLVSGENMCQSALLLRDFLMMRAQVSSPAGRQEVYGKTLRAFLAYLKNESLTRLYAVSDEPFTLPFEERQ